jgi:prepilin-type N-terminal cleavage/methylation domain-containing protein
MKLGNNKGFTLIELLIVIAILCIVIGGIGLGVIGGIIMGNEWYSEEGVLRKIQLDHPQVAKIIDSQRNTWGYSIVKVEENGQRKEYCLDSNILFNYKVLDCKN